MSAAVAGELARRGYETTAFDIAPSALARCRELFPGSPVTYVAADVLDPPRTRSAAFDLVARNPEEPLGDVPWPLSREGLGPFEDFPFESFADYLDNEDPPVRRFRAVFVRR